MRYDATNRVKFWQDEKGRFRARFEHEGRPIELAGLDEAAVDKAALAALAALTPTETAQPVDPNLARDERGRACKVSDLILAALKEQPGGVLGSELAAITARYGAPLHDLRRAGWQISRARVAPSVYRYTLTERH